MFKTINFKLHNFGIVFFSMILCCAACAYAQDVVPRVRNVQSETKAVAEVQGLRLRLLADQDFAPFSFQGSDALQKGIAVELGRAACQRLRLNCEIKLLPFDQVLPALRQNEGDVIISGPRVEESLLKTSEVTRAFFVSTARFAARKGTKIPNTTPRELSGLKLGHVANSAHARFLKQYYSRADLKEFKDAASLLAALKSDAVDVAFSDTLQLAFWLNGSSSGGCCAFLDKPYVDRETFSRGMVFVMPSDRRVLREAFDAVLDALEEEGVTEDIVSRYVPLPLW